VAGVGWHGIEAGIAILARVAAGSIALIGFRADSMIEAIAGFVLLWRFAASRVSSESAERHAQKLIAISFYVLAAYVGFEAVKALITAEAPAVSWVGIGLSVVTLLTMPRSRSRRGASRISSVLLQRRVRGSRICSVLTSQRHC
jgi:divalent metal cation (Fe/Co/Zn/Cd) transporter